QSLRAAPRSGGGSILVYSRCPRRHRYGVRAFFRAGGRRGAPSAACFPAQAAAPFPMAPAPTVTRIVWEPAPVVSWPEAVMRMTSPWGGAGMLTAKFPGPAMAIGAAAVMEPSSLIDTVSVAGPSTNP